MKDWQHGYELEYLKEIESRYSLYNHHSCSPFSEMKKNTIAKDLHEGNLFIEEYGMYVEKTAKVESAIKMFDDVVIGKKEKGDRIITRFSYESERWCRRKLSQLEGPCWLELWAENFEARRIAQECDFVEVGTKVTSFGELLVWLFKDADNPLFERQHPHVMPEEFYTLRKARLSEIPIQPLIDSLDRIDLDYTDHYSNYNKKHSWSALSFRGYTNDPAFITKPEEMNKKWKEEHKDVVFAMQDTPLREKFPELEPVINTLPGEKHRIRLMKLVPGGGELQRHTDQVDKDSGIRNGKIMRFHFPLITNQNVSFTNWQTNGVPTHANMQVGECWYIDTRKPHSAINSGNKDRIHLVVDVEANDTLRGLIGD